LEQICLSIRSCGPKFILLEIDLLSFHQKHPGIRDILLVFGLSMEYLSSSHHEFDEEVEK